jgi:glycosyltransferase involved in cell wall biosynthesis
MMASVGVIDLARGGWTGGATYSSVTAMSLARERGRSRIVFLTNRDHHVDGAETMRYSSATSGRLEPRLRKAIGLASRTSAGAGETAVRSLLRLPNPADPFWVAQRHGLDALFPVTAFPGRVQRPSRVGLVGWLPDFQHIHLPGFFGTAELRRRIGSYAAVAKRCHRLVVSSETVRVDVEREYPQFAHKVRVVPFPSRFAFKVPRADADDVRRHFRLPERYVLCANQFWAHKNHLLVLDALATLKLKGLVIPAVFTGLPLDPRSADNAPTSAVLQAIATKGLTGQVFMLGLVTEEHLEGLLRGAAAVVQPSESEGWNTTVQDAKALGRPLICSDTAVLREQVPRATFVKPCPTAMAEGMEAVWCRERAGHDETEVMALAAEREFAHRHGRLLWRVCIEAAEEAN